MSLLIESIKVSDGVFFNLSYHEQRMNRSLHTLCGATDYFDLERFLHNFKAPATGLYKCRIVYDEETKEIEFTEYTPKPVRQIRLVRNDQIAYEFKYADRRNIDRLFEMRGSCDDILIIKKGFVTDSSYANVVFKRGEQWVTPWSALLKGTMRQNLLEKNQIVEEDIREEDIPTFKSMKLINAMLGFDCPEIDVSNLVF